MANILFFSQLFKISPIITVADENYFSLNDRHLREWNLLAVSLLDYHSF